MRACCRFLVFALVLLVASSTLAQSKKRRGRAQKRVQPTEQPAPAPEPEVIEEPETGWDQSAQTGWDTSAALDAESTSATEDTGEAGVVEEETATPSAPPKWWVGAYLRGVWVPGFMLGLFLEDPPTIGNASFGASLTYRNEDGFSLVIGLGYTGYGFEGPLQKTGDPDEDTEYVVSNLGLLHVTGQMLWSTQVHEMFAIEYGIGVDLGVLLGELKRWEAYRDPASGEFRACNGPLNPAFTAPGTFTPYCEPTESGRLTDTYDAFGAHYGVTEERIPPIALVPMLPVVALRFTPTRELAIKLEASYGILQFAFGLSAAYGLDL